MSVTAEGTEPITAEATKPKRRRNRPAEFTERDAAALQWIGEQYGARLDVLSVLLGRLGGWASPLSISGVRNQVERWKRQGLATAERALGETWVTPTRHGLDRVGLNLPVWKVPVTRVRHCHAVNVVRLWWEAQPQAATSPWVSERMTYRERGNQTWHIPDGVVKDPKHIDTSGPPRFIAVEIELTHKGRRAYQTEVFGNLRSGIGAVSYFVPDDRTPAELASKQPLGAFGRRLTADIRAVLEGQGSTTRYSVQLLPEVSGVSYMSR